MELPVILLGLVALANTILGSIILFRNPKNKINISFACYTFSIAVWSFGMGAFINASDYNNALSWVKVFYISPLWIAFSILFFARVYPKNDKINFKKLLLLLIPPVLFSIILILDQSFLHKSIIYQEWGKEVILDHFDYLIYSLYFLVYYYTSTIILWKKLKISRGIESIQLKIILGSTFTASVLALIFDMFLPWIGNYSLIWIGPVFTLLIVILMFYTIIKYKFLDIRLIFGKISYYVLISLLPSFSFILLVIIFELSWQSSLVPQAIFITLFASIIFVILNNKLNDFIKRQVTTRFINPGYDPYEIVDSLGKDLATTLEIQEVADSVIQILKRTVRAEFNGIVILERKENARFRYLKYGEEFLNRNINPANYKKILFVWQQVGREPLIFDELKYLTKTKLKDLKHWIDPIYNQMKQDGIRAIFPLGTTEEVHGLLMLGQKEADSPYSSQDTELLNSISSTAGLALARSLFYQETKEFAQTLQGKVDRATSSLSEQNKALEMALERLEKIRQREQDMLDVMGHELRTPITIVRNILSMMKMYIDKKEKIPQPKLEDYVKRSLESVKREMILIETLLAATKIDANRVQLNLEKVNLYEVVRDAIEGQKHLAKQRKLTLEFDKKSHTQRYGEEVFVYADRVRIQEIIDNFTSNAVKYTIEGGVTISFEKLENQKGQPMMKINVKDTGIGIPEDDVEKLGRKFFRARQYIKEEQKGSKVVRPGGTGLGLYVSFELIKLMGGEFFIQSKVGEGSTFSFTIPYYTGQEPKHIDQTFDTDDELDQMIEKQKKTQGELNPQDKSIKTPAQKELDETEKAETKLKETKESIENIYIPENEKGDPEEIKTEKGFKRLSNANDIISQINAGKEFLDKDKSDENINIASGDLEAETK